MRLIFRKVMGVRVFFVVNSYPIEYEIIAGAGLPAAQRRI
jgi:hypothetical protein